MGIYKYLSDDKFDVLIENIFIHNLIKFSKADNLNDPFEIRPCFSGLADDLFLQKYIDDNFEKLLKEEYDANSEIKNKILFKDFVHYAYLQKNNTIKSFYDIVDSKDLKILLNKLFTSSFSNNIGILSLTTKKDNLLMWSHYANSHKGIVLEFDITNSFFNKKIDSKSLYGMIHQVKYTKIRPKGKLMDFNNDLISLFTTKSDEWKYECEYRMFMPLKETIEKKGIHLMQFPIQMIKAVYLGCNIEEENKNKIYNLLKTEQFLKHIDIFQCRVDEEHYNLLFHKI